MAPKLDPTQGGRKAKFIRARRMLKGLTVGLVHDKGSRPTQHWAWASIPPIGHRSPGWLVGWGMVHTGIPAPAR